MDSSVETLWDQIKNLWNLLGEPILNINNAKISVSSIFASVLMVVLTIQFAKHAGRALGRSLDRRGVDSGVRDSIERFFRYVVIALGILFSLDNLGISINSLAAVGAVLMVGIGFGLQNIAQNFISGIIILIERPIKVGDIIQVGSSSGKVVDIRVRSTVIQTRDDVTIIMPNSKILSEEVISDSFSGQRIRQHIRVGVAYGSDVNLVKDLLKRSAIGHSKVLAEPEPRVIFEDFGESSLNFDLRFWCFDIWDMDQTSSDIRTEIDRLFREMQVEIPFPQRDIHIKETMPRLGH
ncbi:MAG: transporter [Bdellovibrio sp. CG10_big_fil_rev_8_21_14_0_10_47_8]|nr:MAG: transporter [Bdellovibrio sp. CG10_big_fil_rev_8_21_14_0_10_47_8]